MMFGLEVMRSRTKTFNLNFGLKYPSAHGILRLILGLHTESVKKVIHRLGLLYLYDITEKLVEYKIFLWVQTYKGLDYFSLLIQKYVFYLSTEKLLNCAISWRTQVIHVLFSKINICPMGVMFVIKYGMSVVFLTIFIWTFESWEKLFTFYRSLSVAKQHDNIFFISYSKIKKLIKISNFKNFWKNISYRWLILSNFKKTRSFKFNYLFFCFFSFLPPERVFYLFFLIVFIFFLSIKYLLKKVIKNSSKFKRPLIKAFLVFWTSGEFDANSYRLEIDNLLKKETDLVNEVADKECELAAGTECDKLWLRQKIFSEELLVRKKKILDRIDSDIHIWVLEKQKWYNQPQFNPSFYMDCLKRLLGFRRYQRLNFEQRKIDASIEFLKDYKKKMDWEITNYDNNIIELLTKQAKACYSPIKNFLLETWDFFEPYFFLGLKYFLWLIFFGGLFIILYICILLYNKFNEDFINVRIQGKKLNWPFFTPILCEILDYWWYYRSFHYDKLPLLIYIYFLFFLILFILMWYHGFRYK